jgi:hypothetical protein
MVPRRSKRAGGDADGPPSKRTRSKTSAPLPEFKGEVFKRPKEGADSEKYDIHAYQYATSSLPGVWEPAAIIYAMRDGGNTDIIAAIEYAVANDLSIAVRSGGHQYLGFSSTTGRNIQLDMKDYNEWSYNKAESTIVMGPALTLSDIAKKCSKLGIFFPHGEW